MSNLHVYYDQNSEWIVAESKEEARKIWRDVLGLKPEDYDDEDLEFVQFKDDRDLPIRFEDIPKDLTDEEMDEWMDQDPNNGWKTITKTCAKWTEEHGKGWLCSSECY